MKEKSDCNDNVNWPLRNPEKMPVQMDHEFNLTRRTNGANIKHEADIRRRENNGLISELNHSSLVPSPSADSITTRVSWIFPWSIKTACKKYQIRSYLKTT